MLKGGPQNWFRAHAWSTGRAHMFYYIASVLDLSTDPWGTKKSSRRWAEPRESSTTYRLVVGCWFRGLGNSRKWFSELHSRAQTIRWFSGTEIQLMYVWLRSIEPSESVPKSQTISRQPVVGWLPFFAGADQSDYQEPNSCCWQNSKSWTIRIRISLAPVCSSVRIWFMI